MVVLKKPSPDGMELLFFLGGVGILLMALFYFNFDDESNVGKKVRTAPYQIGKVPLV